MSKMIIAATLTTLMGIGALANSAYAGDKEREIFDACLAKTGGDPHAMAVCIGGGVTVNEIENCLKGKCFGKNHIINEIIRLF